MNSISKPTDLSSLKLFSEPSRKKNYPSLLPFGQFWRQRHFIRTKNDVQILVPVTMEAEFWVAIEVIAKKENKTGKALIDQISQVKQLDVKLANAIKVFVLSYLMAAAASKDEMEDAMQAIQFRQRNAAIDPIRYSQGYEVVKV